MLHHTPATVWALRAARAHLHSARPEAPVVPEPERSVRIDRLRDSAAATLRRVAGWVEPRPARPSGMIGCQPH